MALYEKYDINLARVRFEVGGKNFDGTAKLLAGGQRLKIKSGVVEQIVRHVPPSETLTIRLYGYKLSLPVEHVVRTYNKIWGQYEQAKHIARDDNDRR